MRRRAGVQHQGLAKKTTKIDHLRDHDVPPHDVPPLRIVARHHRPHLPVQPVLPVSHGTSDGKNDGSIQTATWWFRFRFRITFCFRFGNIVFGLLPNAAAALSTAGSSLPATAARAISTFFLASASFALKARLSLKLFASDSSTSARPCSRKATHICSLRRLWHGCPLYVFDVLDTQLRYFLQTLHLLKIVSNSSSLAVI
jgi:hypothetical protein